MTNQEISQGVELVCNTSKEIKGYYDNPETLIAALNRVPKKDLAQCLEYYVIAYLFWPQQVARFY
ncbi:hypothetical protein [Geofilum rhodophaeum]|uniref:hypothetical protein n=1 Tax=Geofilum rhodophaeum TaxID=1965019 RepID=UPI0011BAA23B|nr:hypothetical protein [Geofilum rhodophaeum]